MSVLMQIVERVDGDKELAGHYVVEYDPAILPDGTVHLVTTTNRDLAKRFASGLEALELWKAVAPPPHSVRPWDGRPNRPLTAFHMTFVNDSEAA